MEKGDEISECVPVFCRTRIKGRRKDFLSLNFLKEITAFTP